MPARDATSTDSNKNEPVENKDESGYAYDGEEYSPKCQITETATSFISQSDRACNVIAVALLFMILITSVISIAAGACCLASLSGKTFHHFPLFYAFGVTPVVIGCVCFVVALATILFIAIFAMGLNRYGMCCYGATCCRGALRVCLLGVFPFIVFLVLLAMCILGFTFYSISQQLPPLDKDYTNVDGISGPIDIVRDENGLTHIRASSRRDALFGHGFAEAQDRLFQLEFHRSVGKGVLASLVGNDGISVDTSMRTLNVRDSGIDLCKSTAPEYLDSFQAFADGVNLYMKRVSKRPVEFFFMGNKALYFHNPKPFSALDICITARVYQFQMSANIDREAARFAVWAGSNRTYKEVEELFPDFSTQPDTIMTTEQLKALLANGTKLPNRTGFPSMSTSLPINTKTQKNSSATEGLVYDLILGSVRGMLQGGDASDTAAKVKGVNEVVENALDSVMRDSFFHASEMAFPYRYMFASNAWAARDASDKAMAASDPHLKVNLPSIWYYVHLSFPAEDNTQYDVAGVSLMGIPGVVIGKNTNVAWGITMSMTDLSDLFVLPPSLLTGLPERTYRYGGKELVYVRRRERIKVRGHKDIVLNIDDTLFGPIVTDMLGFPSVLQIAFYSVGLRRNDNTSVRALLSMTDPTVNTAEKLMTELLGLSSPGFSIPIADVQGNIAYAVTGHHPLRPIGHTGKYPAMAFDGPGLLRYIANFPGLIGGKVAPEQIPQILRKGLASLANWTTYVSNSSDVPDYSVPRDLNPHVHIPAGTGAAYIGAANQAMLPPGYPYAIGADFAWPYRGGRIMDTLKSNATLLSSHKFHHDLQMDLHSNIWVKDMQPIVNSSVFQDLIASDDNAVYWADRLLKWDRQVTIGSVEAAFFWRWMQRLSVLPADATRASGQKHWSVLNRYIYAMWNAPTPRMKSECASYVGQAWNGTVPADACERFFADTFKEQAKNRDFKEKWGSDMNRLRGVHEMVEKKIIHPFFMREMDMYGDVSSVCVSDHSLDDNMLSKQASSMRQLYNLWDPVEKEFMYLALPGGNSGNPYSKYYDNMWYKFGKREYVHVPISAHTWNNITVSHSQNLGA